MSASADPDRLLAYAALAGAADLDLATEVSGRLAPALEDFAASGRSTATSPRVSSAR